MSLFRQKKTSVTFWHAPQRAGATCYIMTVTPPPQWSEREETVQHQQIYISYFLKNLRLQFLKNYSANSWNQEQEEFY